MRMSNAATIQTVQAMDGITEECHTYQHWRELGRQVKRGEKARFMAPMWKPNMKKDKQTGEQQRHGFFAKDSAFFARSQTEPITAGINKRA